MYEELCTIYIERKRGRLDERRPRMHPRQRHAHAFQAEEGGRGGSAREGVNGRAAGHPGSENPEKYVIVSSTVITKNRTNERRNERLNVARVGVRASPPPFPTAPPFSPSRMDTGLPVRSSPPSPSSPRSRLFFPSSRTASAADAVIVRCSSRCIVVRNNDFIKIHARGRR